MSVGSSIFFYGMKKLTLISIAGCLLCLLGVWAWQQFNGPSRAHLAREIRLLTVRDPEAALQRAQEALSYYPHDISLKIARAEAQIAHGELETAINWYVTHEQDVLQSSAAVGKKTIRAMLNTGHHASGERLLNRLLTSAPNDTDGLRMRSVLRLSQGRMYEARDDLAALLDQKQLLLDELVFLSSRREFLEDKSGLEKALQISPRDSSVLTGLGALAAFEGQQETALSYLVASIAGSDAPVAAWAELGRLYFREGNVDAIPGWEKQLPERCSQHPDVQFVMAWALFQTEQYQTALRELGHVLRTDGLHREANQLIAQILNEQQVGKAAAEALTARGKAIHDLEELAHQVLFGDRDTKTLTECASLCAKLGESKLSSAWLQFNQIISRRNSRPGTDQSLISSIEETVAQSDANLQAILLKLETDQFGIENNAVTISAPPTTNTSHRIQLVDMADQLGLTVDYFGGLKSLNAGVPIAYGFGGGVAVIDLDSDDQPDLYFTQGNSWPLKPKLPEDHQDLFYCQRHGRFDRLPADAVPSEFGFGQGVACGDINSDGFQDLYVANVGANRLLVNNGDGTFDAIDMPLVDKQRPGWTTSCLMADLNSDGIDDLYDCQYATGPEPFNRKCLSGPDGEERGCSPTLFQPEADRVLIGDGFGNFIDQSISTGVSQATGRGLGLVLANLDDQPGLELFISNDMTSNHLWKIATAEDATHFKEIGLSRGVASNGVGQVEASMGIAAADFSGDGRYDLFVTNFFEETNTFYQGQPAGFFRDQSQVSQLGARSLKLLGFGCQSLDADLDSDCDLLLVNGHVDDYRHRNVPWKMKPSFFQNRGAAEFQLNEGSELATYGQQPALGRACARLDFNRDGKPDAVVTHLDRHPALLQNQTEDCGHSLTIRCVGHESNRPAVGTEVRAKIGQRVISMQRVAGDGYYCSNDWNIVIGCGPAMKIDNLEVTWPSGQQQSFKNVSVNQRVTIVEGTDRLYEMRP